MITQYPWASVKAQERKHIEFGIMITMLIGIITLYSIPKLGNEVTYDLPYTPPAVEVISIPATIQPPERVEPMRPSIPVGVEKEDMAEEMPWIDEYDGGKYVDLAPPEEIIPNIPIWAVEIKPEPIGGYLALMRNVVYPEIAREAGMQGTVSLKALIGKDGVIKEVIVVKGLPKTGLNEAAIAAVYKTAFTPAYQRDKPVQVWMSIPIIFKLH